MSKITNNRIPFKVTNNKKSPLNINEIDINLLMQYPTHIRKLMGRDGGDYEHEDSTSSPLGLERQEGWKKNDDTTRDYLDFLRGASSSLINKYMNQNKKKGLIEALKNKEKVKDFKWSTFDRDKFLEAAKQSTDSSSFIYTPEEMKKMRKEYKLK